MKQLFHNHWQLGFLFVIPALVLLLSLAFRFDDIKGSFLLDRDDFVVVTGEILVANSVRYGLFQHKLNLRYSYSINGVLHESTRVSFSHSLFYTDEINDITDKFKLGDQVEVYLLRDDHKFSVLEPFNTSRKDFSWLFLFSFVLGVILTLDRYSRLSKRQKKKLTNKNQTIRKKKKKRR